MNISDRSMSVFDCLRPYDQKSSGTVRGVGRSEMFAKSFSRYGHGTFTFQKRKNYSIYRIDLISYKVFDRFMTFSSIYERLLSFIIIIYRIMVERVLPKAYLHV